MSTMYLNLETVDRALKTPGYLNLDRRKTRLEAVITLQYVMVSTNTVYCRWLYLKDGAPPLDQLSPRAVKVTVGVSLVAIFTDLVLIGSDYCHTSCIT